MTLSPALGWQAQLEKAITEQATAFAVHVGAKGVVNWVEIEVRLALSRATGAADYPFIPILAKECAGSAALPPFARQYQGVRDPLNDPEEFAKLLRAVLAPLARRKSRRSRQSLRRPQVDDGSRRGSVLRSQRGDCRARRQAQAAPADRDRRGQRRRQVLARPGRARSRPFAAARSPTSRAASPTTGCGTSS